MTSYRVIAIPQQIAQEVRADLKSPQYGHLAHVEVAKGYGPCRSCLQPFRTGEENRILFTYNPFAGLDPYPSPGPIFIHEEYCTAYNAPGFPKALRELPLILEGYGRGRWLITREQVVRNNVDEVLERLFSLPAVEYVHVRNAEAGCFIAHIERA
jgi:hypothetical protein